MILEEGRSGCVRRSPPPRPFQVRTLRWTSEHGSIGIREDARDESSKAPRSGGLDIARGRSHRSRAGGRQHLRGAGSARRGRVAARTTAGGFVRRTGSCWRSGQTPQRGDRPRSASGSHDHHPARPSRRRSSRARTDHRTSDRPAGRDPPLRAALHPDSARGGRTARRFDARSGNRAPGPGEPGPASPRPRAPSSRRRHPDCRSEGQPAVLRRQPVDPLRQLFRCPAGRSGSV